MIFYTVQVEFIIYNKTTLSIRASISKNTYIIRLRPGSHDFSLIGFIFINIVVQNLISLYSHQVFDGF